MTLEDFSGTHLLFARPEERLSLVSLGSRSGCSEPPLSLSSEWAPLPQAPPWTAPRQGSGPGSQLVGVRRSFVEMGGGEPLIGGAEPSGVLRLLAPWFPPSSWFTATSGMATSGKAVSTAGSSHGLSSTGSCRMLSWPGSAAAQLMRCASQGGAGAPGPWRILGPAGGA
jgi:hypothetical protein